MTANDIKTYVLGGKSNFTVESTKVDKRFTFLVTKDKNNNSRYMCGVMCGSDNTKDYRFLGWFYKDEMELRTSTALTDIRYKFLKEFLQLVHSNNIPPACKFYPSGKCARCGRKLTTPESIERGFGPGCYEEVVEQRLTERNEKLRKLEDIADQIGVTK